MDLAIFLQYCITCSIRVDNVWSVKEAEHRNPVGKGINIITTYLLQNDVFIVEDCKIKISINSVKSQRCFVIPNIQPRFNTLCKDKQKHIYLVNLLWFHLNKRQ